MIHFEKIIWTLASELKAKGYISQNLEWLFRTLSEYDSMIERRNEFIKKLTKKITVESTKKQAKHLISREDTKNCYFLTDECDRSLMPVKILFTKNITDKLYQNDIYRINDFYMMSKNDVMKLKGICRHQKNKIIQEVGRFLRD